ncbi:MAG: KTSC domain-containing protein [Methanobacteriaceae archaeon]
MLNHEFNSERWDKATYDETSEELTITTVKNKDRSCDIIKYYDVPIYIFENLVNSENHDEYIKQEIKPRYKTLKAGFSGLNKG